MKLAFSTLGCPDWSFNEIYATARDLRFNGIEIRGVANELCVPRIQAFDDGHIEKSIKLIQKDGLEIPMLTSGISVGTPYKEAVLEALEYIKLAKKLNTRFVRIMVSPHPDPEPVDLAAATELYTQMCCMGEEMGVTPLIETNGVLADSTEMKKFMEGIASGNKGVLWDVHHPYRFFGETPQKTLKEILPYVKYIHVKDSIMQDDKLCYRMMGYGDVPIFDAVKELKANGYDGYISLEWVKRWNPDLEEAGIVFAHFMSYMGFMLTRM